MSKRQMQEGKQGAEDERVVAKSGLHDSQPVSKRAEFELISQPRESQSTLYNLGFIEYKESCRDGFEREQGTEFSSVAHRFCPELKHGETCCEIEKRAPWSNFDPSHLTVSPHNVGCRDKKIFANVRQKLGRPKEDKMDQIETNAMIWRIFVTASRKRL